MEELNYSFIIPVYNRPQEVKELLESFVAMEEAIPFEVVIVDDGSTLDCASVVNAFSDVLQISYYMKSNSGPGDSRNFGMSKAKGNYFIILDSDCILPSQYLTVVDETLREDFFDCYGGPDAAHASFSNLQKAINFAMTSFITTGGIRGLKSHSKNFQPRSFNMGISKKAFMESGGFGNIHPGEDPDLSLRLLKLGFRTKLISKAFVYHKRRISWSKFYKQVHNFGQVRPILNQWHPKSEKLIFWLPTLFSIGLIIAVLCAVFSFYYLLILYVVYFGIAFLLALFQTKKIIIAIQSIVAIFIQFFGYGYGFLKSTIAFKLLKKTPETYYPNLFF